MARITIELPDELDKRLRIKVVEKYGSAKGSLGRAIQEAIRLWLEKEKG